MKEFAKFGTALRELRKNKFNAQKNPLKFSGDFLFPLSLACPDFYRERGVRGEAFSLRLQQQPVQQKLP